MMESMKRGLVIVYDPNSLRQFIWYYTTVSKDIEWDALCFPYGGNNIRMEEYCKKTEIFENVFLGEKDYYSLPLSAKFKLFVFLFVKFIKKKQYVVAKKILNEYVEDSDRYRIFVTNTDTGFLGGLLAQFGKDRDVIYLEDGSFDYRERNKYRCSFKTFSFGYWQGLFMSHMGYCSKGRFYFEPTANCIKYCTTKSKMKYVNYQSMYDISFNNTDMVSFKSIIGKLFPKIESYAFENVDTVVFTDPISDFTKNSNLYRVVIEKYISENSKEVMLKKHPRDMHKYEFGETKCVEIDKNIPAELILPYVRGKKLVFFMACSIMLSLEKGEYYPVVLFFDEASREKDYGETWRYYSSEEELEEELRNINCEWAEIVHI